MRARPLQIYILKYIIKLNIFFFNTKVLGFNYLAEIWTRNPCLSGPIQKFWMIISDIWSFLWGLCKLRGAAVSLLTTSFKVFPRPDDVVFGGPAKFHLVAKFERETRFPHWWRNHVKRTRCLTPTLAQIRSWCNFTNMFGYVAIKKGEYVFQMKDASMGSYGTVCDGESSNSENYLSPEGKCWIISFSFSLLFFRAKLFSFSSQIFPLFSSLEGKHPNTPNTVSPFTEW